MREKAAETLAKLEGADTWSKSDAPAAREMLPNRPADLDFLHGEIQRLKDWFSSSVSEGASFFQFNDCNSYLRRCFYVHLENNYAGVLGVRRSSTGLIEVFRASGAAKEEVLQTNATNLADSIGFRLVFEMLVKAQKPMVGHNCFFDLLFLYRWLEADLPDNLDELKQDMSALFPAIYDTKFIASSGILGKFYEDNALGDLYASVRQEVDATLLVEASEDTSLQLHDAGYDAYITGACFACFYHKVGFDLLQNKACNRLFLLQSLFTLSLCPSEPSSSLRVKGTVFHLSGFSKETKTHEVLNHFSSEAKRAELLWIDAQSGFVIVPGDDIACSEFKLPDSWRIQPCEKFFASKSAVKAATNENTVVRSSSSSSSFLSTVWNSLGAIFGADSSSKSTEEAAHCTENGRKRTRFS